MRGAGSTRHYEWSTPSHGKIVVCQVLALISVHVKDKMRSVAQKQYELVCTRVQNAHVCWTAKKPCEIVKTDNVWIGRRYMLVWYHENASISCSSIMVRGAAIDLCVKAKIARHV